MQEAGGRGGGAYCSGRRERSRRLEAGRRGRAITARCAPRKGGVGSAAGPAGKCGPALLRLNRDAAASSWLPGGTFFFSPSPTGPLRDQEEGVSFDFQESQGIGYHARIQVRDLGVGSEKEINTPPPRKTTRDP